MSIFQVTPPHHPPYALICRTPHVVASESTRPYPCQDWRMSDTTKRSLTEIGLPDLLRLSVLASEAEAELFARNPQGSGRYAGRLLGRALCQGAALHYVNMQNGVKDFDIWSFYAQLDDWPFPPRWRDAGFRPVEVRPVPRRSGSLLR